MPATDGNPLGSLSANARRTGAARKTIVFVILIILFVLVCLARLLIGTGSIGWSDPVSMVERSLTLASAVIIGVALATSGVGLQALLRNTLAEPFILGLSTGAAIGVFVVEHWVSPNIPIGGKQLGAILGSAVAMLIVYTASRKRGTLDPVGLLLIGVVISTIGNAFLLLLNKLVRHGAKPDIMGWMMGYMLYNSTNTIIVIASITAVGLITMILMSRAMDVASLSDAEAISMGVNLPYLRTTLFLISSILAAGAVVLAGPIGFVGLIAPHLSRMLLGPKHGGVVISAAIVGAVIVITGDTASVLIYRWLGIGMLPIGIFTAILGGPLFLWMLRGQLGRRE